MDILFGKFEINLDQLSALSPTAVQALPASFSKLRRAHIQAIILEMPPGNEAIKSRLEEMLVPKRNLNPNGSLLHNIFRMFEYSWNTNIMLNNPAEMKRKAFLLRKEQDGCFDDTTNRVFSQPKRDASGFYGCSCAVGPENQFMGKPFLYSFQMASMQNMNDADFAAEIRRFRAGAVGGPNNRIAVSFRLASRELVPQDKWIVDHDGAGFPGHVTIAVFDEHGLHAEEEDNQKFYIPELSNMNWELTGTMYVCEGRADWRDDYFPCSDGWRDAVVTFELIMRYGGFDEYLDIWRVHSMLHGDQVGKKPGDAKLDISVPLQLALDTVRSFLYSGECDPNESNAVVHSTISYLQKAVTDTARIDVKPSAKQFESAPALLTNNKSAEVNLDECSTAAIELLTEECRKFNIVPVFGSAFALSDEPTISFPGAHAITVTHGMETLCFTWNGDTFKDCVLDEIGEVEEGMISFRLSDQEVRMSAKAAEWLFKTVVQQQTLSIAQQCRGITLHGANCCKRTLLAYKASGGDLEWIPLCWRHKQQILK